MTVQSSTSATLKDYGKAGEVYLEHQTVLGPCWARVTVYLSSGPHCLTCAASSSMFKALVEGQEAHLEHQALLAPVRQGELNLAVQAPRAQQGRVQGVRPVGCHDDLDKHAYREQHVAAPWPPSREQ